MDCPFGCVFSYVIVILRFPADCYAKGSIVDRGVIVFYGVRLMVGVRWGRVWCVVWVFDRLLSCLFFCQVDVCCGSGCRGGGIGGWGVFGFEMSWGVVGFERGLADWIVSEFCLARIWIDDCGFVIIDVVVVLRGILGFEIWIVWVTVRS